MLKEKKLFVKKCFKKQEKYDRTYVKSLENKRLSFSKTSDRLNYTDDYFSKRNKNLDNYIVRFIYGRVGEYSDVVFNELLHLKWGNKFMVIKYLNEHLSKFIDE